MDEDGRLRSLTQRPNGRTEARKPQLLGDAVGKYIASRLEPQHDVFSKAVAAWNQTVPDEYAGFCRLAEVRNGTARIVVSSPSHLHCLRLLSAGLLAGLQKGTGKKIVKNIRFEIGR
jgi:hypothetical protein